MTYCDVQTTSYGKWILVGEHAVVRDHPALVFPIKEKQLILSYNAFSPSLGAEFTGESGGDLHLLFWSVLEHGMQLLSRSINQLRGHFYLDSNLPVGVGMGASAALCVVMSRWFAVQNMIEPDHCQGFARELEHLFHGKSSGLDIAGVSSEEGVYFKSGKSMPLKQKIHPNWYLSSCNQMGITSHCTQKVAHLWEQDAKYAREIDQQMADAALIAQEALEQSEYDKAQRLLTQAIKQAAHCFLQWGLVSDSLQQHMNHLYAQGAIAVKPTGSGGGGFVLSLWEGVPPAHLNLLSV